MLVVPLLAAGFAFGLVTAATHLTGPLPKPPPATSIVWADRVFSSSRDLASWLKARGVRYEDWAASHPAASAVLERRNQRSVAPPSVSSSAAAADKAAPAKSNETTLAILVLVASILGVIALLVVAGPRLAQISFRRRRRVLRQPSHRRHTRSPAARPPRRLPKVAVPKVQARPLARRALALAVSSVGVVSARGHDLRTTLALSFTRLHEPRTEDPEPPMRRDPVAARVALRQHAPDIALYAASALLACVIGISIALYLN